MAKTMAKSKQPTLTPPKLDVDQLLRERLRELGAIGGRASAETLTPKQRSARAKRAARARWAKSASARRGREKRSESKLGIE
jgi:hypothetical protein